MIVVLIIALLAMIGVPNFYRMTHNAKRASCFNNQRAMGEQATLYAMDNNISANTTINVSVLLAGNYVTQDICECPESNIDDYNDYEITFSAFHITKLHCDVEPVSHFYTYPD